MRALLALLVLALTGFAGPEAKAQEFPDYDDVYVNDFAEVLSLDDEGQIRSQLTDLFQRTGVEAVVVTITTMSLYGHPGPIEPFATELFNTWGVGDARLNNGALILVAKDDRQMRIELGSGYGPDMDGQMQDIIDDTMLPEFRAGRSGSGITLGVDELVGILLIKSGKATPAGFLDTVKRDARHASALTLSILAAIGAALLAGALRLYQMWRRSRPRYCPVDGQRMVLMAEEVDDSQLKPGQTTEEHLGSVDYDVWDCPHCQHVTIEAYPRWFTGYGACRSCSFRTLQGTTTVLKSATTSHSGLKRIDYQCFNCSVTYSTTKTIPQVSESSSGRSSFGGGSSSGGGASGRW